MPWELRFHGWNPIGGPALRPPCPLPLAMLQDERLRTAVCSHKRYEADIALMSIICDLEAGTLLIWVLGLRNSTMTASRPPRGSVFLVEDEVMIRMMVADMLDELGYSVAAEAGEINEAIKLAQSTEFDIAILDVNVNGKVISPVAELIKARNRPFIFATGYGSQGLPEEYRDRPALQKPFQIATLGKMIEGALKGATV
jgi:CheY-like chemotaxis protein